MTTFKAFNIVGLTLLVFATGSCSSPHADKGYEACKNPLKWSTPGCKKLFETMKTEDTSDSTSSERIINGVNVPFGEYPWFAEPLEYWGGWYGKFPRYVLRLLNPSQSILILTFILPFYICLKLCPTRLWSYVSFS